MPGDGSNGELEMIHAATLRRIVKRWESVGMWRYGSREEGLAIIWYRHKKTPPSVAAEIYKCSARGQWA